MEDRAMIEWPRVLAPFVGLHPIAPTLLAGLAGGIARAPARSGPNTTGSPARLWVISTEFLIETGPDEGPRFSGA
jgi:hypothetical protein